MRSSIRFAALAAVLALVCGCSDAPDHLTVNSDAQAAFRQAERLIDDGQISEGVRLLQPVRTLHPDDPRVAELLGRLPADQRAELVDTTALGFNRARRAPDDMGVVGRVLLYLPDRLLDLLDLFTISVDLGPQAGAGVWFTRALQGVAFLGSTAGVGVYQKRSIGGRVEAQADLSVGPVGGVAVSGARAGTGGVDATANVLALHTPDDRLYQEYRDYYGIGTRVGLAIVGVEVEIHPVELIDFIGGWFTWDLGNDDLATTRSFAFSSEQADLHDRLTEMLGRMDADDLGAYREAYPRLFGK